MEKLCGYCKGSPPGSGPNTARLMNVSHYLQQRLDDTEGKKNQGKGTSIVPFIGRLEAKKNLKRRHLWLHEGSGLETTTVWHNVTEIRYKTTRIRSVFPPLPGNLKSSGLCCPSSDTGQTLRSSCLPQHCSRKPDFQDKLVLLTLPPWCRSSSPACPPCSRP